MNARREQMIEQLSAYLDNELTPAERAQVEAFLESDAEARAVLSDLRAMSQAVHALPHVRASDRLLDEVRARMERDALLGNMGGNSRAVPRESSRSLRWLAVAAVLALSGTSLYMVTSWSESDRPAVMLTEAKRPPPAIVPSAQPESVVRRSAAEEETSRSRSFFSLGSQEDSFAAASAPELVDASAARARSVATAEPDADLTLGDVVGGGEEHAPVAAVVDVTYPDVETQSRAVEMLCNNFAFANADDTFPIVAHVEGAVARPAETRASGRSATPPSSPVAGNTVASTANTARVANPSREVALFRAVPSKALNQTLKEVQDQGGLANVRVVNRGEYVRLASNVSNNASFGVNAAASRPREAHYYLYGMAGAGNQLDVREVQQVLAQVAPTQNVLNVQAPPVPGQGQSGGSRSLSYGAHAVVADGQPSDAPARIGGAGGSPASPARSSADTGGFGGGDVSAGQAGAPPQPAVDSAMAKGKAALSEPQPAPASEAPASLPAVAEATSVDRNWAMNEAKQRSVESPALRRVAPSAAAPRAAANRAIDASAMADRDTARAGQATLPAGGAASRPAQVASPQGGVLSLNMDSDFADGATSASQPAITETLSMGQPLREAAQSQPSDEAVVLVYLRVAPASQPAVSAPTP